MAELKVAHVKRVKSLYKRACRLIEAWYDRRDVIRYEITLMRDRFDRNATLSRRAGHLLYCEGEDELFKKSHWHLRKFPESPGGTAYQRIPLLPDWMIDYWHPLEKAQYPTYFETREKRKLEYVKLWMQTYYPEPPPECPPTEPQGGGSEPCFEKKEEPCQLQEEKEEETCNPCQEEVKESDECGNVKKEDLCAEKNKKDDC